jgi:hypothetical protein
VIVTTYATWNSFYQVDHDAKKIRRLMGTNAPTIRQGEDGVWQDYEHLSTGINGELVIKWGTNDDGSARCTITSPVVDVETVGI